MGKFEHGFGTQLGAVLLWRRVPFWKPDACSLELPNKSCRRQTGDKKRDIFSRNSEGALGSFCG